MEMDGEIQDSDVYNRQQLVKQNIFRPLVLEAKDVLRRTMLNGPDKKLAVNTALEVLDRAGETKKTDNITSRPVIIKDSQVQLLVQVAGEIS